MGKWGRVECLLPCCVCFRIDMCSQSQLKTSERKLNCSIQNRWGLSVTHSLNRLTTIYWREPNRHSGNQKSRSNRNKDTCPHILRESSALRPHVRNLIKGNCCLCYARQRKEPWNILNSQHPNIFNVIYEEWKDFATIFLTPSHKNPIFTVDDMVHKKKEQTDTFVIVLFYGCPRARCINGERRREDKKNIYRTNLTLFYLF